MLIRHKKLMAAVLLVGTVVTLAVGLLKPAKYSYSSSLEIGSITEQTERGESRNLIDKPQTLLAKIVEGYIPQVQQEIGQKLAENIPFRVTAKVPKGSSLIVLETQTTEEYGGLAKQFEQRIIELVKSDHARTLDLAKVDIKNQLADEKRNLAEQQDAQKVIQAKLEYNKGLTKLLEKQLSETGVQINDIAASRKNALNQSGNASRAITVLMLNSEMERSRQRLANLEERLQILLPTENELLTKEIADTVRNQEGIKTSMEQLQVRLRNIQETNAIIEPSRSVNPVGLGLVTIISLGLFLSALLAFMAAFFAEMIGYIRVEMAKRNQ
jgi:hypothetical protein